VCLRKKVGEIKSFEDFISLIDNKEVNKRVIEALVLSGAMDSLYKEQMSLEEKCRIRKMFLSKIEQKKSKKIEQQMLFSVNEENKDVSTEKFTEQEILSFEHQLTEIYWSGHPLEKYINDIKSIAEYSIIDLPNQSGTVKVVGMISVIKKFLNQNKQPFVRFMLEDLTGEIEVVVFNRLYEETRSMIHKNSVVYVEGRIDIQEEKKCIIAEKISLFETIKEEVYKNKSKIYITVSNVGVDDEYINKLKKVIDKYPGNTKVYFKIITQNFDEVLVETEYKILPSSKVLSELKHLIGENCYQLE